MCKSDVQLLQRLNLFPAGVDLDFPHRLLDLAAFQPRVFARACHIPATHTGGPLAPPPVPCISTGEATHACDRCPAVFETKQQLSVHKFRVHGTRVPYSQGAVCRACLKAVLAPTAPAPGLGVRQACLPGSTCLQRLGQSPSPWGLTLLVRKEPNCVLFVFQVPSPSSSVATCLLRLTLLSFGRS